MTEIKELIQTHDEYLMLILFGVLAMMIITFAVHHFTERIRFPKYLPGLISFIVGLLMLAGIIPHIYDKSYLGNLVISMVAIGAGVIGLAFGLILGVMIKTKNKNKNKVTEIEYEEY